MGCRGASNERRLRGTFPARAVLVAALVLLATMPLAAPAAPEALGTVTLSAPERAGPQSTVLVHAQYRHPAAYQQQVQIYLDGVWQETFRIPNLDGSFQFNVHAPSAPGSHVVRAVVRLGWAVPTPVDPAGEDVFVVVGPPDAPTNVAATLPALEGVAVDVAWQHAPQDPLQNVSGYRIERKVGAGAWQPIATLGASATSHRDTTTSIASQPSYRVLTLAPGQQSAPATATPPGGAPAAVESVATSANGTHVTLSWTLGAAAGPLQAIEIVHNGVDTTVIPASATTYGDARASAGTHTYVVRAANANARGAAANASATLQLPSEPLAVDAVWTDVGNVTLTWEPPAFTDGAPILKYRIYRGAHLATPSFLAETFSTSFAESGLSENETWRYQVSAVTTRGEGARSAIAEREFPEHFLSVRIVSYRLCYEIQWTPCSARVYDPGDFSTTWENTWTHAYVSIEGRVIDGGWWGLYEEVFANVTQEACPSGTACAPAAAVRGGSGSARANEWGLFWMEIPEFDVQRNVSTDAFMLNRFTAAVSHEGLGALDEGTLRVNLGPCC